MTTIDYNHPTKRKQAMSNKPPTLERVWDRKRQRVGYRVGIQGASNSLWFGPEELHQLHRLITDVLNDGRSPSATALEGNEHDNRIPI